MSNRLDCCSYSPLRGLPARAGLTSARPSHPSPATTLATSTRSLAVSGPSPSAVLDAPAARLRAEAGEEPQARPASGNLAATLAKKVGLALLVVCGLAGGLTSASAQSNVNLATWSQQGVTSGANWNVQSGGQAVFQTVNTATGTLFVSPNTFIETTIRGRFGVQTASDDDFIGIVFGYQAPLAVNGDNPYYNNFILFDWKQLSQSGAATGFRLAKVLGTQNNGTGTNSQFWPFSSNASIKFTTLGSPLVNAGWADNTMYEFELVYQSDHLSISIKGGTGVFASGATIFDVDISDLPAGTFPNNEFPEGHFGFYNLSQENVRYESFTQEGEPILLTSPASGGTVAIGNVRLGETGVGSLTISNVGGIGSNLDGTVSAPTLPLSGPLPDGVFSVPQGNNTVRDFAFAPVNRTAVSQSITVDSDGGAATIHITGRGVGPVFQSSVATGGQLDVGAVQPNGTGSATLTVSNPTSDPTSTTSLVGLTLIDATISGPDAGLFAVTGFTPGQVVGKGQQTTLTVEYTPNGFAGSPQATLTLTTDEDAAFGTMGNDYSYTLVDSTGPTAAVTIAPVSPVRAGVVGVTFNLSEPVAIGGGSPWFTCAPAGSGPTVLAMTQDPGDPLRFTGSFVVGPTTANGTAHFAWSGVDLAGNPGTAITSGATFVIDKVAPTGSISLGSPSPLGAGPVSFALNLSESVPAPPTLSFLGQALTLSGGPVSWVGSIFIDGSTPEGPAAFQLVATDAAGNVGTVLTSGAEVVIDTTAPPATSMTVVKHPAGYFVLQWGAVSDATAVTYEVYRANAPFSDPSGATLVHQVAATTVNDIAPFESTWYYGIVARDAAGNASPLSNVQAIESDPPPPEDVTNFTATGATVSSISVSWTASANGSGLLDGYRIYRGNALLGSVSASTTSYTFTGLQAGKAYALKVSTFDTNNRESLGVSITSHTVVPNPANVTATPRDEGANVTWSASSGAALDHYAVYVSGSSFANVSALTPTATVAKTSTAKALSGLTNGAPVWVAVVAVNASGFFSPAVTPANVTPQDVNAPEPPTALVVTSSGPDSVALQWSPSADSAGDLAGYRVRQDGAEVTTVPAGTTSYALTGLAAASAYAASVTAFDGLGNESAAASRVVHTWLPHPTTVTLAPHDQSFGVSWTASQPPQFVGEYRVYVSETPFTDVAALSSATTVSGAATAATLAGLTNGTTYYVAVAAQNLSGGMDPTVSPVTSASADDAPPPNPTGLTVTASSATSATLSWTASANPSGDLAGYRVYLEGGQVAELAAGVTSYEFTGLSPASANAAAVSAFDTAGNESSGASKTVYTWVANPTGLVVTEQSHQTVKIAWAPSSPAAHVANYRIYFATAPFTDVSALTPAATVSSTTTTRTLTGLVNGTAYHAAVTAVTKSGGENPGVTPVIGTPAADLQGPTLSDVRFADQPLAVGGTVGTAGSFSVAATDPAGVSFVRFRVDGAIIGTDTSAGGGWKANFYPEASGDGPKTLTVEAQDALGNLASLTHAFVVTLAPPAPPVITSPAHNSAVNAAQVLVQGTGKAGTTARVYVNGTPNAATSQVDGGGTFSSLATLTPGPNTIAATLSNSGGESAQGAANSVVYDNTQLSEPKGLTAGAYEGGVVELHWFAVVDTSLSGLKGYRVYRAAAPFTDPAAATLLTAGSISKNLGYEDLPPSDGTWYYAVTAESNAGTQSVLSTVVSVVSDATPPTATAISFEPLGAYDAASGRVGEGPLKITLTFNEPLLSAPFLSLTVPGAQPIPLGLGVKSNSGGLIYSGTVAIGPSSPSGLATAILSARDLAGNRGTTIVGPHTVLLDTDAPAVVALTVTPANPIQNDSETPTLVQVEIELDTEFPAGIEPELTYRLSATAPTPEPVVLAQLDPTTWTGGFLLPGAAGSPAETLSFAYLGVDDLGNESTAIQGKSSFELFQGTLPPLVAPLSLTATAAPGGEIALTWTNVAGAAEYQLYRRPLGAPDFAALTRVVTNAYTDLTPADGTYQYMVSSIRAANGLESESGPSPTAQATSDSVAPNPPQNLQIALAANGIALDWQPPAPYTETVTYALYRATGLEITDISGMEPLVDGLSALLVVDPTPSQTEHAYVVASVDAVGNVSLPSNSAYLNPGLLPVSTLHITHDRAAAASPVVTWTHPSGDLDGFVVSVNGADVTGVQPATVYSDALYASGGRTYGVRAVDIVAQESLERTLRLIPMTVWPAPNETLVRGRITTVDFDVTSAESVTGATLRVRVGNVDHLSAPFNVVSGGSTRVPVVVGGYASLAAQPTATLTTRRQPNAGERVDLIDSLTLPIRTDTYVASVFDLDLERGATGTARFGFTNTGDVPVELVLAKGNGATASDEVRFALLDGDGNVLSTAGVKQATAGVLTLPNGRTVARVQPGETFTSAPMTISVPASAPDQVVVRLTIDKVHYQLGQPDHVSVAGLSTTAPGSLVEPPYVATVTSATPALSYGEQPIVIAGTAVSSSSGAPAANVPVTLVIRLAGFQRTVALYTDAAGAFSHSFTPTANEGGTYDVWAKYPDLLSQPVQAQFTVQRVYWNPKSASMTLPVGYAAALQIGVGTAQGTPVTNFRLEPGVLPTGIAVTPVPKDLSGGANTLLTASVEATADAPESGTFQVTLVSDERTWGTLPVSFVRTTAQPKLHVKPTFVETGAIRGSLQTEEVILTNKGLAAAQNVQISLLNAAKTGPAPSWAQVAAGANLGSIANGESKPVTLAFAPTAATVLSATAPYSFVLRAADEAGGVLAEIPVYAWVSESGEGAALFRVVDMYTGTTNPQGQFVTGLAGAKIKLDRLLGSPFTTTVTSDANGEVLISALPAGSYHWRISASGHEAVEGNVVIKPGVTASQEVFLPIPFVTIEWEVTEITIEDKYEVVLSATFETDVPAPVVVIEPPSIKLPAMQPGDVFLGEFKLSNYGLIKTQETAFQLPNGGNEYAFELLSEIPEELAAHSSVTVPYRVVKLDGGAGGSSSGGGCGVNAYWGGVSFGWYCANGNWVWGGFPVVYLVVDTSTCPSGSPSSPTITGPGPNNGGCCGGGPGTGWVGPSWKPQPSAEKQCDPCEHPTLSALEQECCKQRSKGQSSSEVGLITGDYLDDIEDLPIKVLGWDVLFRRAYRQGQWIFELQDSAMRFEALGGQVSEIRVMGGTFVATDSAGTVFNGGNGLTIFAMDDGAKKWRLDSRGRTQFYFDADGFLIEMANVDGHVLRFDRDAEGRTLAMRDHHDEVFATYEYTPAGKVAAIESTGDGRRVEYAWTGGRLSQVTDPAGRTVEYQYSAAGLLTRKRQANGRVVNIVYSPSGMVTSVLDDEGNGEYYQYDYSEGTLQYYSAVIHTDGRTIERWFTKDGALLKTLSDGLEQVEVDSGLQSSVDANGNVTGVQGDDGQPLTQTLFDTQGRVTREVDPQGLVKDYTYGAGGQLTTETHRDGVGGPVVQLITYGYDALGQLTSETISGQGGAPDQVTTYEYDAAGNITRAVAPDGTEIVRTWNAAGQKTSEMDGVGNVTEWDYDEVGRLVQRAVTPVGTGLTSTESWAFADELDSESNVVGTRVTYTDPDGLQSVQIIDFFGRTTRVVDPWGRAAEYAYDSQGDPVRLESAEGNVTEIERETLATGIRRETWTVDGVVAREQDFDAYGRLVRSDVMGEEANYFYEGAFPKPIEVVQPGGRTLLEYDALGNVLSERYILDDGTEFEETHTYDGGRPASHTNSLGQTKQLHADPGGRPTEVVLPSGRTITTAYDAAGRPVSYTSPSGDSTIALTYGAGSLVDQRTLPSGATLDYEYDAAGHAETIHTSWGTRVEVDVDQAGRAIEKRWYANESAPTPESVGVYDYDAAGRRTLMANADVTVETEYDALTRGATTTYDYGAFTRSFTQFNDSLGRVTGLVMPDGTAYGYEYDPFGRVSAVVLPDGNAIDLTHLPAGGAERTYPNGVTWSAEGQLVLGTKAINAYKADGTDLMDWSYEHTGHRVTAIQTESGDYTFQYDTDEQLVGATYPTLGADAFTYDLDGNRTTSAQTGAAAWTHDAADQLLAIGAGTSFTWTAAGDLASRTVDGVTTTYEYDAAERLAVVRDNAGQIVAEYAYDPDGLRISKTVAGSTTYYLYGEHGLLAEYDDTGAELRRYIWIPTSSWQDQLAAYESGGQRYFPLFDGNGEVTALTGVSGNVAWKAETRAFGQAEVSPQATVSFPLRRSGQYHDPETGLHYNTARYYDPALGRYISTDPLLEVGGQPNLYLFAFNNPVAFEDRIGLQRRVGCGVQMTGLELTGGSCSFTAPTTIPGVNLKVEISVSQNKQDCCKDGNIIKDGKGCTDYKLSGGAEVGFGIPNLPSWLGPVDSEIGITAVSVSLSGSCSRCTECGGTDKKFEKCCIAVEVGGPSLSFSTRWFNVSFSLGSVTLGQLCYGPGGFTFVPFAGSGPTWGAGAATPK